ncbi:hypothetical protein HK096_004554 [Nowakowskiella sp. JEL0078]|nr:hypothetical protein HK096_004554 [Nowakowskiella sp. JEL0078]
MRKEPFNLLAFLAPLLFTQAQPQNFNLVSLPPPVYGNAFTISSAYNQLEIIGGTLAKKDVQNSTSGILTTNQFFQLDFVGTIAYWKKNANSTLPYLQDARAVSVNSGKETVLLFGIQSWTTGDFNEDYASSKYDPASGTLTKIITTPPTGNTSVGGPDFRAGHSISYDPKTNQIFSFGGYEKGTALSKDLWVLNLTDSTWRVIKETTYSHPVSLGTWSEVIGSYFVVCFGTASAKVPPVDLCSLFSITSNQWIAVTSTGTKPAIRSAHRMVVIPSTSQILLYGGGNFMTGETMNDVWTLDATKFPAIQWTKQSPGGDYFPSSRCDHGLVMVPSSNIALIFGGRNQSLDSSEPTDTNIYALDTDKWTWLQNWAGIPIPKNTSAGPDIKVIIIVSVVVGVVVLALVIFGAWFWIRRKKRAHEKEMIRKGKYVLASTIPSMDIERTTDKDAIPMRTISAIGADELASMPPPAYTATYKILAKANFEPRAKDEIELLAGDEILVLESYTDGWARGENLRTNQTGMFPVSKVDVTGDDGNVIEGVPVTSAIITPDDISVNVGNRSSVTPSHATTEKPQVADRNSRVSWLPNTEFDNVDSDDRNQGADLEKQNPQFSASESSNKSGDFKLSQDSR